MKKIIAKYGNALSALALFIAITTTGFGCGFVFHQPVVPDSVKKLRKF